MPTDSSLYRCPHCGKPSKMFEQSVDTIQITPSHSPFSEAIQFASQFGVITAGSFLTIWLLDWSTFWLAPTVGLVGAIGLTAWAVGKTSFPSPPPPGKNINLTIDVTEKKGISRRRTVTDVFRDCRPTQLYKLANAHLNEGVPLTRRKMGNYGVSEGQFTKIRDVLVVNRWADLDGDHDNATAIPNWQGRSILRQIERSLGDGYSL